MKIAENAKKVKDPKKAKELVEGLIKDKANKDGKSQE